MLSPGDGIALAGVCILAFKIADSRIGSRKNGCRTTDMCAEHSGVEANIEAIQRDISDIKAGINNISGRLK